MRKDCRNMAKLALPAGNGSIIKVSKSVTLENMFTRQIEKQMRNESITEMQRNSENPEEESAQTETLFHASVVGEVDRGSF